MAVAIPAVLGPSRPVALRHRGPAAEAWGRLRRNRLAMLGLTVLAVMGLTAGLTPWIAPYGYERTELAARAQPPSWAHPFGTDELGRDVLTRV
ncbi:MAG TPA: hypothetical protein VIX41_10130, partial [Acidimicrobiales bacterium]